MEFYRRQIASCDTILISSNYNFFETKTLKQHLRSRSRKWVRQSRDNGNDVCCLTGTFWHVEVHHPTGFDNLYSILLKD